MNQLHQYQMPETDEALALGTDPVPAGPYYQDEYFDLEGSNLQTHMAEYRPRVRIARRRLFHRARA